MAKSKKRAKIAPEETICPLFAMAFIMRGDEIKGIIKEEKLVARCIGPECQMYFTGTKACGLRSR